MSPAVLLHFALLKERSVKTPKFYFVIGYCALLANAQAAGLPDTGQASCYSTSGTTDCVADANFPRQDGSFAGTFVYTKLDAAGNALGASATEWACVRDESTGLVWEAKAADSGWRGSQHRYAWSNGDFALNGGDAGGSTEVAWCNDSLAGLACTSENYVNAVRASALCGASDWRMPSQRELLTIVHAANLNPSIDPSFGSTGNNAYWAADTYASIPAFAWGVHFGYGAANAEYKTRPNHVRLVRGTPF